MANKPRKYQWTIRDGYAYIKDDEGVRDYHHCWIIESYNGQIVYNYPLYRYCKEEAIMAWQAHQESMTKAIESADEVIIV